LPLVTLLATSDLHPLSLHDALPICHRVGELVTPRPLHPVEVPGLDLAEVLRALVDGEADVGDVHARPPLPGDVLLDLAFHEPAVDRKSTRLNSSHEWISYAVFCLKK